MEDEEEIRTAYHEAGHCVLAVLHGAIASKASIACEEPHYHGKVSIVWRNDSPLVDRLIVALAGPVAEMIYRSEPLHPGFIREWAEDWKMAWSLARPHATSDIVCLKMLEQLVAGLYRSLSEDRVWAAIAAVQDLLMAHEEIEHEQIAYEVRAWLR